MIDEKNGMNDKVGLTHTISRYYLNVVKKNFRLLSNNEIFNEMLKKFTSQCSNR